MYKALLTDFDGCLVERSLKASPRVKEAIQSLAPHIAVSIVTGRKFYGAIEDAIEDLQLHAIHVVSGGAVVYDSSRKQVLWQMTIPPKDVQGIIERSLEEHLNVFVEAERVTYTNTSDQTWRHPRVDYQPLLALPYEGVTKFSLQLPEVSLVQAAELERKLAQAWPNLRITKWHIPYFTQCGVDVIPVTKLEGVERYLEFTGRKRSEIIAVGDGYNDFPLLMAAGLKIAMGNAVDELKAIADYVAPSVHEDGIAWVIEKFFR